MTVSRALRNHPALAEATKARVLRKAMEMGYAKIPSLQKGAPQVRRVGVLAYGPDQGADEAAFSFFDSEIPRTIFAEIQKACQANHVETVVEFCSPGVTPLSIRNQTVGAAFLFGRYPAGIAEQLRGTPTLAVSSWVAGGGLPRIVADNLPGLRATTEYLIGLGHRKILFLGLNARGLSQLYQERGDGYVVAMHRAGLAPRLHLIEGADFGRLGEGWISGLMPQLKNFTAVACASDRLATELERGVLAAGLRVPRDLSITGFDNASSAAHITTYAPDWAMMGKLSVDLLIFHPRDIQDREATVVVPGKLIVRGSTAAPHG